MKAAAVILVLLISCSSLLMAQSSRSLLMQGDQLYQDADYNAAEENYRKAIIDVQSLEGNFNLGNSIYNQERYEEAVDHFQNAINYSKTPEQRSKAMYNLGNTYFQMQDLENAIKQYKQAIRQDNTNNEAKYNLAIAKVLQQQQQEQEQQQQQDQQQNEENQDQQEQEQQEDQQENQEQQNQDQQNEEQKEEEQQQQEESKKDSTDQEQPPVPNFDTTRLEKQTLDSLDAMKLLQIIDSEELKIQEKLRKFDSKRKKPEKDW